MKEQKGNGFEKRKRWNIREVLKEENGKEKKCIYITILKKK